MFTNPKFLGKLARILSFVCGNEALFVMLKYQHASFVQRPRYLFGEQLGEPNCLRWEIFENQGLTVYINIYVI